MSNLCRGRSRSSYTIDVTLVIVLLLLAYVYVNKKISTNSANIKKDLYVHHPENMQAFQKAHDSGGVVKPDAIPKSVNEWDRGVAERRFQMADPGHDSRLKNIPDTRRRGCKDAFDNINTKVSIVLTFHEFKYYDMKTTVNSILLNTDLDLVEEIIVIDDFTSQEFIRKDVDVFSTVAEKVRLIRLNERQGEIASLMRGFKEAKSNILVYLQPSVIVNKGWLLPLLHALKENPSSFVTPHFDKLTDPILYDYKETPHNLTPIFTWGLAIRMTEIGRSVPKAGETVPIVALRGSAFAVTKQFLKKVGSFDEQFEDMDEGGEMLEMSFRAWRCGGVILEAPCSRVGVLNLLDPVKIVSHRNMRRVVELWMISKGDTIYHSTRTSSNVPRQERLSIMERQRFIQTLDCKSEDWYLKHIVKFVPRIKESTVIVGILRCKTSSCASIGDDGKILLGSCPEIINSRKYMFEWLKNGQITVDNKCLGFTKNFYIELKKCNSTDDNQLWKFTENGEIINRKDEKMCLMHVTDPDKSKNKRQVLMGQHCDNDREGTFKTWQFVPI